MATTLTLGGSAHVPTGNTGTLPAIPRYTITGKLFVGRAALEAHDQTDPTTQQHAFNALSTAAWHVARGEPAKALARMRRAQSHIKASMEGAAA